MSNEKAAPIPEDLQMFHGNEHYAIFSDVLGDWDTTSAITLDSLIERIATLTAEVAALRENLRLSRDNEELLRYERNSLRTRIEIEKDLATENTALKAEIAETKKMCLELIETRNRYGALNDELEAEIARRDAPVTDAEYMRQAVRSDLCQARDLCTAIILARATPPQA